MKRALQPYVGEMRSSTVSEALAQALGYRTNAALRAALAEDPEIQLFDSHSFLSRLTELAGHPANVTPASIDRVLEEIVAPGIYRTRCASGRRPEFSNSKRFQVWQSVMIAGINAAIRNKLISVRPGDNRWAKSDRDYGSGFHFAIESHPAYCHVSDAGFDEVSVKVTLWPTQEAKEWGHYAHLNSSSAFSVGDLFASGWLERRDGAWLQASKPIFFARRHRLEIASHFMPERPLGYAASGPFRM